MAHKKISEALILGAAEAFLRNGRNQTQAAEALGIPRTTLIHRLRDGVQRRLLGQDFTIRVGYDNGGQDVLVISDLHAPFHHKDALAFLAAAKKKYRPTKIVCIGDEVDNHAISDYPSDPDGMSARYEYEQALEFMHKLYDLFPVVMACESNHTSRHYRKAYRHGLPAVMLRSYGEVWDAPMTWSWADKWEVDGVRYFHGEGCGGIHAHVNAANKLWQSVVIGHVHVNAGVRIVQADKGGFGMNVGCLIDRASYAMKYAKHMLTPITLGCGMVFKGKRAEFIPMLLDSVNRWTGEI